MRLLGRSKITTSEYHGHVRRKWLRVWWTDGSRQQADCLESVTCEVADGLRSEAIGGVLPRQGSLCPKLCC